MRKVLVAVTVTVVPLVKIVELRFKKVEVMPASVLWLNVVDAVSEMDESERWLDEVVEDVVEASELEVTAGMVTVPRPLYVMATSVVGAAISVALLPSLSATSRTDAVTVTSGTRGRMTLPALLLLYCDR